MSANRTPLALCIVTLSFIVVCSASSMGDVITYQDGQANAFTASATVEDTLLFTNRQGDFEDNNYGNSAVHWIGTRDTNPGGISTSDQLSRALIRFDVTSLAGEYSQINSVTLRMYYESQEFWESGLSQLTLDVFPVAPANENWIEGNGGKAGTGESAWAFRNGPAAASTPWAGSTGLSAAGTDYTDDSIATYTIASADPTGVWVDFTFDLVEAQALIDDWVAGDNAGLLIVRSNDLTHFDDSVQFSSEAGRVRFETSDATNKPQLIIDYTPIPIPEPASIALMSIGCLMAAARRRELVKNSPR